jgi:hypothetical protein
MIDPHMPDELAAILQNCVAASDDDRLWFERHPARNHRLRHPIGGEAELTRAGLPDSVIPLVAVRQLRAGERVRVPISAPGVSPAMLNSETVAADAFAHAVALANRLARRRA